MLGRNLILKDKDLERIEGLSKLEHKDKSTIARELLEYGWEFLMIRYYKEGKLSLEGLSRKLDISISEAIDLLAKLGIEAPIEFDEYLKGFEVFRGK
ncbi:MAG: hypothetical protein L3J17_11015 [Candidatus Jettenia sp.]|nr:MAG: hypothetical protein L3J17_11015 [Candidatus Jettenia sp.]